ncbi:MAG TPA: uridine kinase [Clostridiaceae bacterium]|nr:uridine kinase [Clostridiaceae bacterium]
MKRPLLIGISGGTGSGKSTVVHEILNSLPEKSITILEQDAYYKEQSELSLEERLKINYDHPDAFDTPLLVKHLKMLVNGQAIDKPVYDFSVYNRSKATVRVEPRDIIILEGILILQEPDIRSLLDIKIYVDTDPDVRIIRRITRDIKERGRTYESVVNQYLNVVRPMHLQFVEPSKRYADIIIPEGGYNKVAIDIIVAKINSIIQKNK